MNQGNYQNLIIPPPLQRGDLLKVIAPSGALRELTAVERGLDIWRSRGYRIEFTHNWDTQFGYLAGTDEQRREALAEAWFDPDCKGILCLRGGYGGMRLLEDWKWGSQKSKVKSIDSENSLSIVNCQLSIEPKWLIGFSDVTSLLWSLASNGYGSVHAPVLTTLADEPQWSLDRLFDCVEGRPLDTLQGQGWGGGVVRGWLLPGNLTVATHLLHTPLQPSLEGAILALEDVTEAPYRIDRLLTQWRLTGAFKGIVGIALGRFSRCEAPQGYQSWSVAEVLRDRVSDLKIPIVSDLPFGHDGVNAALPVGYQVTLDSDRGLLHF